SMKLGYSLLALALYDCSDDKPATMMQPKGCTSPDFAGAPLGVHCNALSDDNGRTVLLHGVNARIHGIMDFRLADGSFTLPDPPPFTAADAAAMRAMGLNALRLPINWSLLEPSDSGGFDETVMANIAAVVDACRAAHVFVLLDLHQDGYAKITGTDGAPDWAVVPAVTTRPPSAGSGT